MWCGVESPRSVSGPVPQGDRTRESRQYIWRPMHRVVEKEMKMTKILMSAIAVVCAAGAASADMGPVQVSSASGLNISAQTGERPTNRGGVITATYDFATGAIDYYAGSNPLTQPVVFDPSLGGLRILGLEASDIVASVNWNTGASFENWASEIRIGFGEQTFGIIGLNPFIGQNSGPAVEGTSLEFTGGGFAYFDVDGTIDIDGDTIIDDFYMPLEGAAVGVFSTYNDGSGLNAGTITGGTVTFTLEIPTPGSAALLGLAGLAAVRRRR